jgi:protein arginine N-methyltransferase 3
VHCAELKATQVRVVEADSLLSKPAKLHSLDLVTMKRSDQDFSTDFLLKPESANCECSCIVLWFDTEFSERFCTASPQVLSTSPHSKATHWAQTVLPLKQVLQMTNNPGKGDTSVGMMGRISMSRQQKYHRTLDISLEYAPMYSNGTVGPTCTHIYSIGVNENTNTS